MRIAIVGAGALGTLFGYHLAAENEVIALDVRPEVIDAVERNGLIVEGEAPRRVRATMEPAECFGAEIVFVFVRATDTLRALRPFAGQLNPAAPIVSLQNGLGNEEAVKTALGGNIALVLGVTTESSLPLGHGRVRRVGDGTTVVGSGGASPQTCTRVARLLEGCGLRASAVYDIRPHLWGKLIVNAALNPLCAILDRPNGGIPNDPNAAELARALVSEGTAVAKALHVQLPFDDPWAYVNRVAVQTAEIRNSMALDLASGHRTEIEAINGAIVAAGRRAGVPTPYNDAVTRLIKAKEHIAT